MNMFDEISKEKIELPKINTITTFSVISKYIYLADIFYLINFTRIVIF